MGGMLWQRPWTSLASERTVALGLGCASVALRDDPQRLRHVGRFGIIEQLVIRIEHMALDVSPVDGATLDCRGGK